MHARTPDTAGDPAAAARERDARLRLALDLAVAATAVLVDASAAAASANARVLVPRCARLNRRGRYAAAVLTAVAGLDLLAVSLIQLLYAWRWHPDPRRFGLGFDLTADGVFILAHFAAAALVAGRARRWRRPPARPDVATAL